MSRRRRRRLLSIGTTALAVVLAIGAAVFGAVFGDQERVAEMWISARLDDRGLTVTEVIDYDFGYQQRHGIYRTIPDLLEGAPISVTSPTAPDEILITPRSRDTEIRVGDPASTTWQRHRYEVGFTLDRDAVVVGEQFSWNAVGTEWTVEMKNVTVALALDTVPSGVDCRRGDPWDSRPCPIEASADGILEVRLDDLAAGDAVTISGFLGQSPIDAALPEPPSGPADDPGTGVFPPILFGLVAASVAAVPTRALTRRAGREQVWQGGAADAAYGEADEGMPVERMSERQLSQLATIEFEPPRGMSAVEGALILDERVRNHHLAAWLLESAIRDEVSFEGEEKPVMHRGDVAPAATVGPILDRMFDGRETVRLGKYDKDFTKGWNMLSGTLDDWLDGADHWDRAGHRRQTAVRAMAGLAGIVGLAIAAFGGVAANTTGSSRLWIVAVGAALVGAAGAALASSWELLVRTPKGSSLWLRIESFRRFLHESEARHVTEAADRGVLRQYTAWAIALDETDAWTEAVEDAVGTDPSLSSRMGSDLAFITMGSHLGHAASAASTKPSSSGSGGGFSGGAGGGGGGGGGGSW